MSEMILQIWEPMPSSFLQIAICAKGEGHQRLFIKGQAEKIWKGHVNENQAGSKDDWKNASNQFLDICVKKTQEFLADDRNKEKVIQ
ncbi:MAG: hypothetical protein ACI4W2_06695, partial [Eubacterium sp.]